MDLKATADYVKFTMTLAAGAFAYARVTLDSAETVWGLPLVPLAPFAAIALLAVSTLTGVFVVSAATGAVNESARFKAQIAAARKAKDTTTEARLIAEAASKKASRDRTGLYWLKAHVWTLVTGFVIAAVVYTGEIFHPVPPAERCTLTSGDATISFDCAARTD